MELWETFFIGEGLSYIFLPSILNLMDPCYDGEKIETRKKEIISNLSSQLVCEIF